MRRIEMVQVFLIAGTLAVLAVTHFGPSDAPPFESRHVAHDHDHDHDHSHDRLPREDAPTPKAPEPTTKKAEVKSTRKVGYVVFLTNVDNERYLDQLAVQAYSIKSAIRKSKYDGDAVVLGYNKFIKEDSIPKLKKIGFDRVLLVDLPVQLTEVQEKSTRDELDKHTADLHLITEVIKVRGYELIEYDRVFMIDGDTLVLGPMDELAGPEADDVSLFGTFDYGMHVGSGQRWPPVQGGFLCMKPNKDVYNEITNVVKTKKFCCGKGWDDSKVGWYYGGVGPQGLLAYYYLHMQDDWLKTELKTATWTPGRKFVEVDQCVYDVLSTSNCVKTRLNISMKRVAGTDDLATKRKVCVNDECRFSPSEAAMRAEMRHVHFTSTAHFRPWSDCEKTGDGMPYGSYNNWICVFMNTEWWRLRTALEKEYGLPVSRGYCNRKEAYEPIGWGK
eukprot:m.46363 g.46363  ORF g.46363 m.46363 type:complete len:445 (-) comp20224_c0_seq1:102-1436(-)